MSSCVHYGSERFSRAWEGYNIILDYDAEKDTLVIEVLNPNKAVGLSRRFTAEDSKDIQKISSTFLDSPFDLFETLKNGLCGGQNSKGTVRVDARTSELVYECKPFASTILMVIKLNEITLNDDEALEFALQRANPKAIVTLKPRAQTEGLSNFTFSDDKKTVKKTGRNDWDGVLTQTPFYPTGIQRFSVKLLTNMKLAMVGAALKNTELTNMHTRPTAWLMYFSNGDLWSANVQRAYHKVDSAPFLINDVVTVVVDMDKKMLHFELNDVSLGPAHRLNLTEDQKLQLYPAVSLANVGESLAFE